jgi:flavin-dependent dehydrogenase
VLHTDEGSAQIDTPLIEKRIAVVHRGHGPKGCRGPDESEWNSFDEYVQTLAVGRGARLIPQRVKSVRLTNGKPEIEQPADIFTEYDVVVVATGVNAALERFIQAIDKNIKPPKTTRAGIREFFLGKEEINRVLGNSMHMFLLNLPRLEFAAIIPKGEYASVCLLGDGVDQSLISTFLDWQGVQDTMSSSWQPANPDCRCLPKMAISGISKAFSDRVVFIGDAGISRLYKDGIGAAYKTAKAAAATIVLHGVSEDNFHKYYEPVFRQLRTDNRYGRVVFFFASIIRRLKFMQRAILNIVRKEQTKEGHQRYLSSILWDMFTGSAPYRSIFFQMLRPVLCWNLVVAVIESIFGNKKPHEKVADLKL